MEITSCGQRNFVQGNVPAGTLLHPPFTVTLTEVDPETHEPKPDGLVGAAGIHGHRIEKTARLKLDIKDATGAEPAPLWPLPRGWRGSRGG